MSRRRVAIATSRPLPEPDPDEHLLVAALGEAGLSPSVVAWDDAHVRWASFDLVVIRSTWDYHHRADAYLRWVDAVGAATRLLNPAAVVRWNAHKGYLLALESQGVPVAPTELLRAGWSGSLAELLAARGWDDVVIKPAVSAGSHLTLLAHGATATASGHLARILAAGDALVQRYLPEVEASGERAVVCIDGSLTHAVRKTPRFLDDDESVSDALPIAPDEAALAAAALAAANVGPLLYARVDMVRDGGGLRVMELELIEPSLFLLQHPPALHALVRAVAYAAR